MTRLLSILLLAAGCATQPVFNELPTVRKTAPVPVALADIPQRSISRSVTSSIILPPKPLFLVWDYDQSRRWEVSHFRIYSNTTLAPAPWPLFATTTNQSISFMPTNTSRFFYCTAYGVNGTESLPNTK